MKSSTRAQASERKRGNKMDDYIKRKDALQAIESCAGWSRPLESAYEEIQAMPAADVASVAHSYWIVNGSNPSQGTCGNCGGKGNWRNPYCPNCGAKMDKEDT